MKKNLKNIAKILIVSVLLTSCASENLDIPNQDTPLAKTKKWFDASKPDLKVLNYTSTIDWNNSIISSGDKGTIIEVPLLLKDNIVAKVGDDKSFKTFNRLMFYPDEKETYKTYQVLITTNDKTFDSKSKECNFYKLNTDFNGYITVLNSKNEITDFGNYIDSKSVTKPILNKTTSAPVVCVYYGYWDENDEFHAYYQVGCYGGGASGGGSTYGSGGGKGDADPTSADKALCEASLADITSQAFSTSTFLSATTISENSNTRTKQYKWEIFNCLDYSLTSYETGMHKKVINTDPNLQWEWVSLTHNNIASTGFVLGVSMSYMDISNLPTIGLYNSIMNLNYSVKFTLVCQGFPAANELSYTTNHIFKIND
jgi:hypothetical protein